MIPRTTGWRFGESAGEPTETLGFAEIIYVKFFDPLECPPVFKEHDIYEKVTVLGGEHFHVRTRREDRFPTGFFGYPTNPNSPFSQLFFTVHGVLDHDHENPIGELLRAEGLIEDQALDAALAEQKRLRQQRLGEILVEKTPLPAEKVEDTLSLAQKHAKRFSNTRVGEILIEAGLVTPARSKRPWPPSPPTSASASA
ncbi:MAG: hypothetical protein MZU95_13785 [Desulfomicrobium escambiense]|nr:hypothetical protein [Desulfomicrobium escambiense]